MHLLLTEESGTSGTVWDQEVGCLREICSLLGWRTLGFTPGKATEAQLLCSFNAQVDRFLDNNNVDDVARKWWLIKDQQRFWWMAERARRIDDLLSLPALKFSSSTLRAWCWVFMGWFIGITLYSGQWESHLPLHVTSLDLPCFTNHWIAIFPSHSVTYLLLVKPEWTFNPLTHKLSWWFSVLFIY